MKLSVVTSITLAATVTLFACAGDESTVRKASVAEDTQELTAKDFRVVGNLEVGTTSRPTRYEYGPRYRAFTFAAAESDEIDLWVRATGGDPMAWVLDADYRVVAYNDDAARGTRDAHLRFTAHKSEGGAHTVIVRDYDLEPMVFTVELSGTESWAGSCNVDADCEKIDRGCCPMGDYIAVREAQAEGYRGTLACAEPVRCPRIGLPPDARVSQCNAANHRCELRAPEAIPCGAFSPNPHACPAGYACKVNPEIADAPGRCEIVTIDDGTSGGSDVDADCRNTGCDRSRYCSLCWGSWSCVPRGAKC